MFHECVHFRSLSLAENIARRLAFVLVGKDNAITTKLKELESNRFETAGIYGRRLVAIEEADKYGGAVSVLKAMTGQDSLRLERKGQQQEGFPYCHKALP